MEESYLGKKDRKESNVEKLDSCRKRERERESVEKEAGRDCIECVG